MGEGHNGVHGVRIEGRCGIRKMVGIRVEIQFSRVTDGTVMDRTCLDVIRSGVLQLLCVS